VFDLGAGLREHRSPAVVMKAILWAFLAVVALALAGGACGGGGKLSGSGGGTINPSGGGGLSGIGNFPPAGGAGLVGGTAGFPGNECGGREFPLDRVLPELLIVLDTSASMNDAFDGPCAGGCGDRSKWAAARAAINDAAFYLPAIWGLKFVAETRNVCDTGGIAVPIGFDSDVRIPYAFASRSSGSGLDVPGNTPTRAAIDVAAAHLSGRPPGPHHAIVLLTDGAPDCKLASSDILTSDAAGAVQAIEDARSWGFDTLVVGIGNIDPAVAAVLDAMARAGGRAAAGTPAYVPAPTERAISAALSQLVEQEAGCTFYTPDPPTNDGTTSRFNIGVYVNDLAIPMGGDSGWTYTDDTGGAIELHGAACDAARAGQVVKAVFRCNGLQAD
jgi:hypothetical protein